MTLDSRVVNPFRRRIAKRYFIWCGAAVGLAIACILLICIDCFDPFINIMLSCLAAFAVWLGVSLWFHHRKLLSAFDQPNVMQALDAYVGKRMQTWENESLFRILIGAVLTIFTVLFIFYQSDNKQWLAISGSLLVSFILYCMLKSWNYYLDGLLLHDVQRSDRDQADMSM